MKKLTRLFHVFIVCALFLGACNLPSNNPEGAAATYAAQTVEALLTPSITPTISPASNNTATPTLTPLPTNTNTPAPTATPTCPQAQFVTDVTIPDGTVMTPGQSFTKKWRIRNTGECAWNGYNVVFDTGDSMGGPASKPVGVVNPGQEIDVEVNLTAPATAGNYRGYWRIVTNNNVLVPMLNGYQGRAFYVDIKVQAPATATNTSAPAFAVTSVVFEVTGTCPNFHVKVNVTTNAAGTVKYKFVSQDGSSTSLTDLVFAAAGTKVVEYDRFFGVSPGSLWTDMYVDQPNNQQFGRATFVCP